MRLWSLSPRYLDSKGLVALWREGLLAKAVLEGNTRGYRHHPQLARFNAAEDPIGAINSYLEAVWAEAMKRDFGFNKSKIGSPRARKKIPCTTGQLDFESSHLLKKLERCDPEQYKKTLAAPPCRFSPVIRHLHGRVGRMGERNRNTLKIKFMHDQEAEKKYARAILVGIELVGSKNDEWGIDDSLAELEDLSYTAGLSVVDKTYQKLKEPNPKTFIGKGKVEEIRQAIVANEASTVIFDDELSPVQNRNLERIFGENIKVIDRTALILDIFAKHARTKEGQLQVELAQYEYRLPRLTKLWTHLASQSGAKALGGAGMHGPGETQLETDRRVIKGKIGMLKRKIEEIREFRSRQKSGRAKKEMQVVAIVGYTNTGKSSLLNALCDAEVLVEDKLFSTLDPTMKRIRLPSGMYVLATDTVGFIKKLPHNLVAAFRATLEGMTEADLILHVADVTHPMVKAQMKTTDSVLEEQGVAGKPRIAVWNKADLLPPAERTDLDALGSRILTSAKTGEGLDRLRREIEKAIGSTLVEVEIELPYAEGALLQLVREHGSVQSISHNDTGSIVSAFVPDFLIKKLEPYLKNKQD